jgi:hypothetical protein
MLDQRRAHWYGEQQNVPSEEFAYHPIRTMMKINDRSKEY